MHAVQFYLNKYAVNTIAISEKIESEQQKKDCGKKINVTQRIQQYRHRQCSFTYIFLHLSSPVRCEKVY